jgi:glycosyltransferase involved in cell wall biosynthesis
MFNPRIGHLYIGIFLHQKCPMMFLMDLGSNDTLTIVVLLHRDEATLRDIAAQCIALRESTPQITEILLINSASPDQCGPISREIENNHPGLVRAIDTPLAGYGLAVMTGIKESKSDWVTIIDGDLEYRVEDIPLLFSRRNSSNVILSFRYVKRYSQTRRFVSYIYNNLIKFRFGIDFRDVGSGLRIYNRKSLLEFDFKSSSSFLTAEIPIKLILSGCPLTEVGINSYPSPYRSTGIVKPSQIIRVIRELNECHRDLFPPRRQLDSNNAGFSSNIVERNQSK